MENKEILIENYEVELKRLDMAMAQIKDLVGLVSYDLLKRLERDVNDEIQQKEYEINEIMYELEMVRIK